MAFTYYMETKYLRAHVVLQKKRATTAGLKNRIDLMTVAYHMRRARRKDGRTLTHPPTYTRGASPQGIFVRDMSLSVVFI